MFTVLKSGESTAHFLDVVVAVPVVANDRDVSRQCRKRSGSAASAVLVVVDVAVSMLRQVLVLLGGALDQSIDKVVDCVCRRFTNFRTLPHGSAFPFSVLEHSQL